MKAGMKGKAAHRKEARRPAKKGTIPKASPQEKNSLKTAALRQAHLLKGSLRRKVLRPVKMMPKANPQM